MTSMHVASEVGYIFQKLGNIQMSIFIVWQRLWTCISLLRHQLVMGDLYS